MSVICYSPLAAGWLSGKWRKGVEAPQPSAGRKPGNGIFATRYALDDPANAQVELREIVDACAARRQERNPIGHWPSLLWL